MSHVYRPYPTPQLPRPGAALLPAGGGSVPLTGALRAAVVARADYPMQEPAGEYLAALVPPVARVPAVGVQGFRTTDYPTQEPLLEAVAPIATPPNPVYVFTGLPFLPASVQRPELVYPSQEPYIEPIAPMATPAGAAYLFTGPAMAGAVGASYRPDGRATQSAPGQAAVLDDTVLVVVADSVPLPNAYDRGTWPLQMLEPGIAGLIAPAPTPWLPPSRVAISIRSDYSAPELLGETLAPLVPAPSQMPAVPRLQDARAPERATPPVSPAPLAALASPPPTPWLAPSPIAISVRSDYPNQAPLVESLAPLLPVATQFLPAQRIPDVRNPERPTQIIGVFTATLTPVTAAVPSVTTQTWTRETWFQPQLPADAAMIDAQQSAQYVPQRATAGLYARLNWTGIAPASGLAVFANIINAQLARGETIEAIQDDPRITITFDDRRIYPTRLN